MDDSPVFISTRNHLLITESVVARGTVFPCPGRLADRLRSDEAGELTLHDAEVLLPDAPSEIWPRVRVAVNAILLAHEYVDLGGDPHLRAVAEAPERVPMRVILRGLEGLVLEGTLRGDRLEPRHEWIVLFDPVPLVHGGGAPAAAASAVTGLPYVLVHRRAVAALIESRKEG